jgi:hypothetical protein
MKRLGLVLVGLLLAVGLWFAMDGPRLGRQPSTPASVLEQSNANDGEKRSNQPPHSLPDGYSAAPTSATTPPASESLAISSAPSSVPAPRAAIELPPAPAGKPRPPASLAQFWSWPEDQVERIVTGMQSQPDWPTEQRQFLRLALRDSFLSPVARNNIAAGLMRQEPQIPDLHRDFLTMHQIADENPVWRDYCLQFLAQCVDRVEGPERDAIVAALVAAVDIEMGSLAGTAVVHLARLSETGMVTLDEAFDQRVTRLAGNPAQNEANRSTALAVLGQRGYAPALDTARNLLVYKEVPGITRAAIGVVSLLGTRDDLQLLEGLRSDTDPSVALVATQASKAMNQRLAHSAPPEN